MASESEMMTYEEHLMALVERATKERRERVATAALAGLLTNAHRIGFDLEVWSRDAVKAADALIAELDKE